MAYAGTLVKQPNSIIDVQMNYEDNLFGGSVQTSVVTARREDTGEDVTASLISGVATITSPFVTQRIVGGTAGVVYILEFLTTMSAGQRLEDEIILPVEEY